MCTFSLYSMRKIRINNHIWVGLAESSFLIAHLTIFAMGHFCPNFWGPKIGSKTFSSEYSWVGCQNARQSVHNLKRTFLVSKKARVIYLRCKKKNVFSIPPPVWPFLGTNLKSKFETSISCLVVCFTLIIGEILLNSSFLSYIVQ